MNLKQMTKQRKLTVFQCIDFTIKWSSFLAQCTTWPSSSEGKKISYFHLRVNSNTELFLLSCFNSTTINSQQGQEWKDIKSREMYEVYEPLKQFLKQHIWFLWASHREAHISGTTLQLHSVQSSRKQTLLSKYIWGNRSPSYTVRKAECLNWSEDQEAERTLRVNCYSQGQY